MLTEKQITTTEVAGTLLRDLVEALIVRFGDSEMAAASGTKVDRKFLRRVRGKDGGLGGPTKASTLETLSAYLAQAHRAGEPVLIDGRPALFTPEELWGLVQEEQAWQGQAKKEKAQQSTQTESEQQTEQRRELHKLVDALSEAQLGVMLGLASAILKGHAMEESLPKLESAFQGSAAVLLSNLVKANLDARFPDQSIEGQVLSLLAEAGGVDTSIANEIVAIAQFGVMPSRELVLPTLAALSVTLQRVDRRGRLTSSFGGDVDALLKECGIID